MDVVGFVKLQFVKSFGSDIEKMSKETRSCGI